MALLSSPGPANAYCPTAVLTEIESVDCGLCISIVGHHDMSAAVAQARKPISCNLDGVHEAELSKHRLQVFVRYRRRKISDAKARSHSDLLGVGNRERRN